ncbi:MAG TPA: family 43 glycosylhydrolase [Caulobacter sp.]|nr:family 43 glycosylhydrolase [Caulobacter sp.]
MAIDRRTALGLAGAATLAPAAAHAATGFEGQRRADLGDGTFRNPIVSGDRPDPTIVRDGDSWWMTFSSFDAYPGLLLWRSNDLVNWTPTTAALHTPVGSVWAPELTRHEGRWFLYFHARTATRRDLFVIHADRPEGPWSEPVTLGLPKHIDPGHAVGEDGHRYLFLSGGDRVRLRADGLAVDGPVEHVYDPWRYPDDWVVESFSPEGPKILRHGDWFHMITAVGGTAGPPTGHMVIAARSPSIHGPWEHCPHNPLVRTRSRHEPWWSRGHATLVEGPGGRWWMVQHGYEKDYWTLGRQCLLEPIAWTDDDWWRPLGGTLAQPLPMPTSSRQAAHGMPLSDDFATDRLGVQWSFYDPQPNETARLRRTGRTLHLAAKGSTPADASPLTFIAGDRRYSLEVDVEIDAGTTAGLLLFYNRRLYCGLGFNGEGLVLHRYGLERPARRESQPRRLVMRLTNDEQTVSLHYSPDGKAWTRHDVRMEVSGYHHNTAGDFLSLRPALYAAGAGEARFRNLRYRAF